MVDLVVGGDGCGVVEGAVRMAGEDSEGGTQSMQETKCHSSRSLGLLTRQQQRAK